MDHYEKKKQKKQAGAVIKLAGIYVGQYNVMRIRIKIYFRCH